MRSTKVSSNNLPEKVFCPTSKSYSNRALALAAIDERPVCLKKLADCDDVNHMIGGLKNLGMKIRGDLSELWIHNSLLDLREAPSGEIYLGEGGTTIRFFMALAALLNFPVKLGVHPDFLKRPIKEYADILKALGAKIKIGRDTIEVLGQIKKDQFVSVDCSKTTQFASALSLLEGAAGLRVRPVNVTASSKYLDMTEQVKKAMLEKPAYTVPADFSSLGYFAVFGALTSKVSLENVFEVDRLQADSKVLDTIKRLGGDWKLSSRGLEIFPVKSFKGIEVDGSDCLDLVPSLAFLFAYSRERQVIRNIRNLRFKESDRLAGVLNLLKEFGVKANYDEDTDVLEIFGRKPFQKVKKLEVARDHRMVMAGSLFLKLNGGGEIAPAEAVTKSFPGFFEFF